MPEPTARSSEHPQFDALCAELGDYEPLPKAQQWEDPEPDADAAIDEEILARLISP